METVEDTQRPLLASGCTHVRAHRCAYTHTLHITQTTGKDLLKDLERKGMVGEKQEGPHSRITVGRNFSKHLIENQFFSLEAAPIKSSDGQTRRTGVT